MPRLTVITVNLNNVQGLNKTIESVINQTFTDYEYLVIDGGSTDGSADILRQYSDSLTYWISEPDKGIYNAMNKGICKARGLYCLFLNSGDSLHSDNVLSQVFSVDFNEDIVYGDLLINGKKRIYPEKLSLMFFFQTSLGHPSTLIKLELFKRFGLYNEDNKIVSDWEFFINTIINQACTYCHLKDMTLSSFTEDGISSREMSLVKMEYESVLRRMFPLVYDDYIFFIKTKSKLEYYENSSFLRFVAKLNYEFVIYPLKKISKTCRHMFKKKHFVLI